MKLFIARHGHAVAQASADSERPLSDRGRQEVQTNAERHVTELSSVEHIISSPYIRARQTADIFNSRLNTRITESSLFTPDSDPRASVEFLYKMSEEYDSVLLTSHMPLVSRLTDLLIGEEVGTHLFNTAAIASLECDPVAFSCCELLWLHHP